MIDYDTAKDAERLSGLRTLATLGKKDQDRILAAMGEPERTTAETFNKWCDDLMELLYKEKRKTKPIHDEV